MSTARRYRLARTVGAATVVLSLAGLTATSLLVAAVCAAGAWGGAAWFIRLADGPRTKW